MIQQAVEQKNGGRNKPKITMIDIGDLIPSTVQPRYIFDDGRLAELSESIAMHGILQPLIVRKNQAQKLEIVAGERRFRAARLAKIKTLPCIVMDLVPDTALAIALVENIQREDLNPIEEAKAYWRLKETLKINQEEIATRVGKERSTIANSMRLLRLPPMVQELVANETLSMGHARALLSLDSLDMIVMTAKKIAREGLSVRRVESLVRALKSGYRVDEKILNDVKNPMLKEIEKRLEEHLGLKVTLRKEQIGYCILLHLADDHQLNLLLDTLAIEI
jgi:ParB family transcriptional regulator, chromosome partitioning protein